jgi:hypothetical protein
MDETQVERLLALLDEEIHRSRRSRREIERALGLGQGYLGSLFKGRIELKVWHVFVLARELGIEPLTLFYQAAPPADPRGLLELIGADAGRRAGDAAASGSPGAEPTLNREEVEELVRKTLREELARLATMDPRKSS